MTPEGKGQNPDELPRSIAWGSQSSCYGSWPLVRMVIGILSLLVFVAACDESFVAFEDNDLIFSMYGHLDPSRPTQWLRVTPVRTSIETVPRPVDAVVTIEEVETGRLIVMVDSAFIYAPLDSSGSRVYAHNFSTNEAIRSGFTYRVSATRSDGASSTVTVSVPDDDPWVVLRRPVTDLTLVRRVEVFGAEHVAMLQQTWAVPPACGYPLATYTQYQPLVRERSSPEDSHEFTLNSPLQFGKELEGGVPCADMGFPWLEVVVAGNPWPYDPVTDRRILSHPNVATNVKNGVGFVSGVRTKDFHFAGGCSLVVPEAFCDITLDDESVTLEGTIGETCDGELLAGAAVVLRELSGNRIRSATSDSEGYFRINGLDPGIPYRLGVTRTRFIPYESDLVFEAAEVRTLPTIELEWEFGFDPCLFR